MIWATVSSWSCFGWPYRASPSLAAKNIINLISVLTIWWCPCVEFIFWGSKITADGDCSHEIKRRLLLGRKVMTNLDSILKSRNITFPTKVHLVKAMVFPVVICGRESWIVKKAERWRIDVFELWCWRRLTCGHHQMVNTEIRLIIFFAAKDGEALYSQQKQDQEQTVAQIMNSLLPNSDLHGRK